jgi:serine/threonine protein kinase
MEGRWIHESEVTVGELISQGEFGMVFKARLNGTGAEVALKTFKTPAENSPEHYMHLRESFQEEAHLVLGLEHPNIVKVTFYSRLHSSTVTASNLEPHENVGHAKYVASLPKLSARNELNPQFMEWIFFLILSSLSLFCLESTFSY